MKYTTSTSQCKIVKISDLKMCKANGIYVFLHLWVWLSFVKNKTMSPCKKYPSIHYAINAHMQSSIVLPYIPNGVALGPKSRYATLSERCICEPYLWPVRQRYRLSNATPKMYCIIHIMQHHHFIKATSPVLPLKVDT